MARMKRSGCCDIKFFMACRMGRSNSGNPSIVYCMMGFITREKAALQSTHPTLDLKNYHPSLAISVYNDNKV